MIDGIDDIFNRMDKLFDSNTFHRRHIRHDGYDKLTDEDHIYYTFELRDLDKVDIQVKPHHDEIQLILKEEYHLIQLSKYIIPDKTEVTFKNGILDIICYIDKDKDNGVIIK